MKYLKAAITLENFFAFDTRRKVEKFMMIFLFIFALGSFGVLPFDPEVSLGLLLVLLSVFVAIKSLDFFFVSTVLHNSPSRFLTRYALSGKAPMHHLYDHSAGKIAFIRAGVNLKELTTFMKTWQERTLPEEPPKLPHLFESYFDHDSLFKQFMLERGVSRELLSQAGAWAESEHIEKLKTFLPLEFGSRVAGRGLGASLAFGEAYLLERYSLSFEHFGVTFAVKSHDKEVGNLSAILNKTREANAVLVGDDKLSIFSILRMYAEHSQRELIIFDAPGFVSAFPTKAKFESNFLKLLYEATRAGNIVLVIPDFPEFVQNGRTIGSDVVILIDSYIDSSDLQVIAIATRDMYSRTFEHNPSLSSRFERVQVEEETAESILNFIRYRVKDLEKNEKVFFTLDAVLAVRDSIIRFTPDLVIDATDDLLREAASRARVSGSKVVTRELVLRQVESQTGVPLSGVNSSEREKLQNLENLLHKRIVGQDEAVLAISKALRRARAGVSSTNRPIGSFLFLGPTGVGKTETTKAISDIFFGSESPMVRFDMSEYNEANALSRLIGSALNNEPGTLAKALRENEYGVLLLDEFEKTDKKVIDLFLQILDEGVFSDARGKKVNVRNHIIVATSNAGSDLIFNLVKDKRNLMTEKDNIIQEIIDRGIFKPELLNRFDGTILFHPLEEAHLRKIATFMLQGLNRRLKVKGIELEINDAVIDYLVERGQDPKFGARPLNRAIQDNIESLIASRMLEGSVKPGDKITLTAEDLV